MEFVIILKTFFMINIKIYIYTLFSKLNLYIIVYTHTDFKSRSPSASGEVFIIWYTITNSNFIKTMIYKYTLNNTNPVHKTR